MRIAVTVKPNSKNDVVEKVGEAEFILRVKARPREGKANEAVISLLGCYFGVPKTRIGIVTGLRSKRKIINIT